MIDLGISKLALIGAVALIVIGPERLPRVARTVGTLLGRAQRYVNDVKSEVARTMEMEELRKMKDSVEQAAHDVEQSFHATAGEMQAGLEGTEGAAQSPLPTGAAAGSAASGMSWADVGHTAYQPPRKNWRIKRTAMPHWYKTRQGVRTHVQSGAARVARFRPRKPTPRV
ncbi:MAG: Sec-independent protein translocase protein TatB [Brachymonas sp.]|uniref:Sec-independent protein translocase protein TatB n=1 Tax=Brachymonas sp. M4Q-1 TaxID=3416906 RepID=UPI003CF8BE3B